MSNRPIFGKSIKLDVSNKNQVFEVVAKINPDAMIHCAAITDVDKCEIEKESAKRVNTYGAKLAAEACKRTKTYLILISTDYVFDGSKGMYREEDVVNPVNYYGYSKWLGEKSVAQIDCEYLIARPSVIYGSKPASGKINFALWLLKSLESGKEVKVLTDQFVSPTLNLNLSEMLLECCEKRLTGVYHMAGATRTSRFDFAVKLAEAFNLNRDLIKKAEMSEMDWSAKRPTDSSLNVSKIYSTLTTKPKNLNEALSILGTEMVHDSRSSN